jgi:uncharacterized protein YukE
MDIHLTNLTPYQVEMLDTMWHLDSESEYLDWYKQLTAEEQCCADVLQRLVILEAMEENLGNCAEARSVLQQFRL